MATCSWNFLLCRHSLLLLLALLLSASGTTLNFSGIPDDEASALNNTVTLNVALASLLPGDTVAIPNKTFWLAGGVQAVGLVNATIVLDGTLRFPAGRKGWPTHKCRNKTCVTNAITISNAAGLTLTSTGEGTVHGNGDSWWGYIQYLEYREDRPKLIVIHNATDVLVERWHMRQSPYHTFHADDVARLEIRYCTVDNRVNSNDEHGPLNLAAFNTDGFDVQGRDIHIHDCSVWNQDDCFTIIPSSRSSINSHCTENVLVEDVNASGLGLTVGVVGPNVNHNCIRNVTFRRARMHHTFKGIYIKSSNANTDPNATAEITNVLYEDILIDEPEQVPIWIGPAQEADSDNACSVLWPEVPLAKCPAPRPTVAWTNITLRNILVKGAKASPGVVFGNADFPMKDVVFDRVVFDPVDAKARPWGDKFYYCKGVEGVAMNGTTPMPPCFANASSS